MGAVYSPRALPEQPPADQRICAPMPDQAPTAMVNLGVPEKEQGDAGQARHWWQQAP